VGGPTSRRHRVWMTSTQLHPRHRRRWSSGYASLIPWAAFVLATALADVWVDYKSISVAGLVTAAPLYLVFVALPSALPLAAARSRSLWLAVLVVMTGVAAIAGVLVVTTDDAQAGLAALWVPFVAIPLAGVLWVGQTVMERRSGRRAAGLPVRLAALAIDVVIVGAVLVVPLTAMCHAKQEIAAGVVGIGVATIYLAALVSVRGGSVGQSLVGLGVVDASTGSKLALSRALLRSLIVVVEVSLAPTLILSPIAFAELWSASVTGRSLTDRLLRTEVVTTLLGGEDSNPQ